MTFKEYLEKKKISLKAMQAKTDIDFRVLSRYKWSKVRPSLVNAYKIYKATNKQVKLKDWFDE